MQGLAGYYHYYYDYYYNGYYYNGYDEYYD